MKKLTLGIALMLVSLAARAQLNQATVSRAPGLYALDYARSFTASERHVLEVGVIMEDAEPLLGYRYYEGDRFHFQALYRYRFPAPDKFDFSAGIGMRGTNVEFLGFFTPMLSGQYALNKHLGLRLRLTGIMSEAEFFTVSPSLGLSFRWPKDTKEE